MRGKEVISPTSAKNVIRMIYMPSTHYTPDYHRGSPRQRGWFFTHIPQAFSPSSKATLLFLPTRLLIHRWQNLDGTKWDMLVPSTAVLHFTLDDHTTLMKATETVLFCVYGTPLWQIHVVRTVFLRFTRFRAWKKIP